LELLVRKAITAVKERLLANARPEMKARITQVLSEVSSQVARAGASGGAQPRSRATLRQDPSRTRDLISQCVESRHVEELIDALAIHCEVPVSAVKNIVQQEADMGMLVLGKASGIGWPDMKGILSVALPEKTKAPEDVKALFAAFVKLTPADAQRAVRFIRTSTAKSLDKLKELV
jgi:hypothetical protein